MDAWGHTAELVLGTRANSLHFRPWFLNLLGHKLLPSRISRVFHPRLFMQRAGTRGFTLSLRFYSTVRACLPS